MSATSGGRAIARDQDHPVKNAKPPLGEALEAERYRLFRAAAIVEACRFGSDSKLAHPDGRPPDFNFALLTAYELICDCAEQLEMIAEDREEEV